MGVEEKMTCMRSEGWEGARLGVEEQSVERNVDLVSLQRITSQRSFI